MKKTFLLVVTVVLTLTIILGLSLAASAETAGLEFTKNTEGDAYTVTGYSGKAIEIDIPATYDDLPVTAIGDSAFKDCKTVKIINIPDSVETIGDYAFRYCSELESVNFGAESRLNSIGIYAFFGCRKLPTITLPSTLTSIGLSAFDSCDVLESITIPASVTSIGEYVFSWCIGLNEITVESGNPVYHSAGNCLIRTADKTLIAGTNTSVIPDNGSVEIIARDAFSCRGTLAEIVIPEGVTKISNRAFTECTALRTVSIPSTVTTIGEAAFSYCVSLDSITVAENNTKYHSLYHTETHEEGNCPEGCLQESYCLIETDTNTIIAGCNKSVIPSYITAIAARAFYGCFGLEEINIPAGLISIGEQAFSRTSLERITVDPNNTYYNGNGSCLIETATDTLIVGSQNMSIPDGVKVIAAHAFYNCNEITEVTIPNSVTTIGEYAFYGCTGLRTINIPANVTSIGTAAFSCCTGLESITVAAENAKYSGEGNCLIEIGSKKIVSGCKNSVIPADGSVVVIGRDAFYNCDGLANLVIPSGITNIERQAFNSCSEIETLEIPASVTNIDYRAFYLCDNLRIVYYDGTEAEWAAVTKDKFWDEGSNYFMILKSTQDIVLDEEDRDINVNAEYVIDEVEDVVAVNISWQVPVFVYTVEYEWDADNYTDKIKPGSGKWSTEPATLTVENRSNQDIGASFSFLTTIEDSGIVGKFTSDAAGTSVITDVVLESAATSKVETKSTTYFFVTAGALPDDHTEGDPIGNITILIEAKGN